MRINRDRSRAIFRRQNRGRGCLSWMVTLCMLGSVFFVFRGQLRDLLQTWLAPPVASATLADAQAAYNRGDLERAIAYTRELHGALPDDTGTLVLLVRSLVYHSYADINQDDLRAEALTYTQAAVIRTPYDMTVLGIHAFTLQANNLSEDAQRVALRVIRNEPDSITARLALSLAYSDQGIFEAGLRDAQRAVEIASLSAPAWQADAYRVVALAQSDLGDYADAAASVDTAITHHSRLLALHFERALYAQQIGDMDTATASYFSVIAFDEDNVKARFRLCEVSSILGERDAAIDWCNQVTVSAPGWSDGWYTLGREYYLNGDWSEAQSALNRCSTLQVAQDVPIEEREFECWYMQGQAAEVLRDCEALIPLYNQYQVMKNTADLSQTWVYPDDTPPICASATSSGDG
ncbi:MAG: tetratricopeptide repeat protein [Chloroflexota bacterium]